jgi:hypothetical protein
MRSRLIVWSIRCKAATLCAIALLATSCGNVARSLNLTRTKPETPDIVGVWIPDQATREYMRTKGGYDTSLETRLILEDDGDVKVLNMPDWWGNGFGVSKGSMQSEQGNWRLYQSPGSGSWEVRISLPSGTKFMSLLGQKPPYNIFLYVGDPDSGEVMTFTRSGT